MRVLSGIQPSGKIHLGNYFGAMKHHITLQDNNSAFYFIADYHALTTVQDAKQLRENILDVAMDYLAFGLDPERSVFFKQSDIPQVMELAWVLSTLAPMGLLERCHSYKDKMAKGIAPNHGVFAYPVLMAADILIYQSQLVPVGKDQKQHIEVTRDLALKFNQTFGEVLTVPDEYIMEQYAVIPGIDGQKMSKSYNNTIEIFADEKAIKKKVMSVVTDCTPVADPKDPDACNLFALYSLFAAPEEKAEMAQRYRAGGMGYKVVKDALYDKIMEHFGPYRERRVQYEKDVDLVKDILFEGAVKAQVVAQETIDKVREAVGVKI
ncbi:MAG: tryptophan--tRNA ligase [Candidatus Auribacter fodinae]|jgi:tryptophanyl-tRNA synthetase|uniref:Tryptophan--tRNA ligase n=1 Tax=Candidatus Auribacter fodinae TaxID=2093366 RepID=A0A3A4QZU1_9BACT|nr:MAG: tryptophan--tRNA ligase [Candidatus Auribacter fodinae]